MIPLFLKPDLPSREVGDILSTIRFENTSVTFVRAEKGFLIDGVNGTIQVKENKQDGESVLDVRVSTRGEPRKSLRDGLVMTLVFQIHENAPPNSKVELKLEKVAALDLGNPSQALPKIAGKNGTIEIISPEAVPYVACFFFTH